MSSTDPARQRCGVLESVSPLGHDAFQHPPWNSAERPFMNRTALVISAAALALAAGCGGAPAIDDPISPESDASSESVSASPSATGSPEPAYNILSESALTAALLTIRDLPVGYSQDPPSEPGNKTFCDYQAPEEDAFVFHEFTKGGGVSGQILRTGLRQYETPDRARAAFEALTTALDACESETFQGTRLVYAAMSAPRVGEDSVGVRIDAEGTVLLQNYALVGPTIVVTAGGGLLSSDADVIAGLFETQVKDYQAAATE